MPNIKVSDEVHKRLLELMGTLTAGQKRKFNFNMTVEHLLDEHDKKDAEKCS